MPNLPRGVAYLTTQSGINGAILGQSNVDIAMIALKWSDLEPTTPGVYVFNVAAVGQSLDAALAIAEPFGKPIRLLIQTDTTTIPPWLVTMITGDGTLPVKFFTCKGNTNNGPTVTLPVFWQTTYLARKALMLQAVAAHLATHPLVTSIMVSSVQYTNNDWNPGATNNSVDGISDGLSASKYPFRPGLTPQQRWQNALVDTPYSTWAEACTDSIVQTFVMTQTAFPSFYMSTPIGRAASPVLNPAGGTLGRNIAQDAVVAADALYPGFIIAMKQNLNGGGTPFAPGLDNLGNPTAWNDLYVIPPRVVKAAQMVWNAYAAGDGCGTDVYMCKRMNAGVNSTCQDSTQMLYQAVVAGFSYSIPFVEIYGADLPDAHLGPGNTDPHIPAGVPLDVITFTHNLLTQAPAPPNPILPSFVTKQLPVSLIPNLGASTIATGLMDISRLPVAVGLGGSHAIGVTPDTGDGTSGDKSDYLARDMTWRQFSKVSYQPTVPNPNIFIGPTMSSGQVSVTIRSMLSGATLLYRVGAGLFILVPTGNDVHLSLAQGTKIQAYGARDGYNNSDLLTYVVNSNG